MNKKQWHVLGWMFVVIELMTIVYGAIVSLDELELFYTMYMYFCMLGFIGVITCLICGWLEKEGAK